MHLINEVNTAGTNQAQNITMLAPEQAEGEVKNEGRIGAHTVKVCKPDVAVSEKIREQFGVSRGPEDPRERAVSSFLAQTDELGCEIQAKLSVAECADKSAELISALTQKINSRADEWLDTMNALLDDGVSAKEVDRLSCEVMSELRSLVDQTVAEHEVMFAREYAEVAPQEREAPPECRTRVAKALSEAQQGHEIPPEKTHVYMNLGGGSCLFHAVMQLLAKCDPENYPVGNTVSSANRLRKKLIEHVQDLKTKMEKGETYGMKEKSVTIDDKDVKHVFAKTSEETDLEHMDPVTEGFNLAFDSKFGKYGTMADVSTAAFLADYLQRPVIVVSRTMSGKENSYSMSTKEFKYGLASGDELVGKPLIIYYDQQMAHFMAVNVEE